jgi:hypothetical protein
MKDVCKYIAKSMKKGESRSANVIPFVAADVRRLPITLLHSRAIKMEPPYVGCYGLIWNFDGAPK